MNKIKIYLADDHKLIRDAMQSYLVQEENIEVLGEANHGEEALNFIRKNRDIDILITDIIMPRMDGIDLVRKLNEEGLQVKVLVMSMISETQHIKKMLNYGVEGYLLKSAHQKEIIKALTTIQEGGTYYSHEVTQVIMDQLRSGSKKNSSTTYTLPFTKREKEVLNLICQEYRNAEIADKLFISIRTVETHKRNILEKSGHKNMAGLALWASNSGLISL